MPIGEIQSQGEGRLDLAQKPQGEWSSALSLWRLTVKLQVDGEVYPPYIFTMWESIV